MNGITGSDHVLDLDTRVEATGAGRYAAIVTDRWHALGGGPNGGYLSAICVRALAAELPLPDPLVVSTAFVRRADPGPASVHTRIVRVGRRLAVAEASLVQHDEERVRAHATFADLDAASGPTGTFATPPDLPAPDACVDLIGELELPGVSIAERVEYRVPRLPGWRTGEPTGRPETQLWLRLRPERDVDVLALPFLVDAAAPVVLELGVPGSSTLQLTMHTRARPAPGWLAARIVTRHVVDGFHEEDLELWDETGRLVAQSRQLGLLPG